MNRRDFVGGYNGPAENAKQHHTEQPPQITDTNRDAISVKPVDPTKSLGAHILTALTALSISILSQDRTLRYTWASGPLAGYPVDFILNRTDMELFPHSDALRLIELKQQCIESGIEVHKEAGIFANGSNYIFEAFIEPVRDENGSIEGVTCAFRDVTEQRTAERELKNARAAADAALSAKSQLLTIMSHEIRTPLNAIVGMAELMHMECQTSDQKDCAEIIRSSGEALIASINAFLELCKTGKNPASLMRQSFDPEIFISGTGFQAKPNGSQLRQELEIPQSLERDLRILIAEDNSINQKVILRMLGKLGFKADVVDNGLEVLRALLSQPYDLVLMDIQMPNMDGIEATRRIRKLWKTGGPRIVAITAYALEGDRERCIDSGMDGYIAKPVRISDLAGVLESLFQSKQKT